MVEKGHEVRSNDPTLSRELEKAKDYTGTTMKAESFLGNLELGELEHIQNFDSSRLNEGMPKLDEESASILSNYKEYAPFKVREVCGVDDRVEVTNTTQIPWRWICQLLLRFPSGSGGGTGWFIGPHTLMTAGHCVFDPETKEWATSIEVIPGMRGFVRPYGSQFAKGWNSVNGWVEDANHEFDYGAIFLPDDTLGKTVGWFGFAVYNDRELENNIINLSGYAGDKPRGTQWYDGGRITNIGPKKIYYREDSYQGQSGSPVWKTQGNQRTAVGIHAYGGCPNSATRIDASVFNNMWRWRNL